MQSPVMSMKLLPSGAQARWYGADTRTDGHSTRPCPCLGQILPEVERWACNPKRAVGQQSQKEGVYKELLLVIRSSWVEFWRLTAMIPVDVLLSQWTRGNAWRHSGWSQVEGEGR